LGFGTFLFRGFVEWMDNVLWVMMAEARPWFSFG